MRALAAAVPSEGEKPYLLVHVELPEDFSRVKQMLIVDDLLSIPGQERNVEQKRSPVSIDEEESCQKCVDGGFWNDVGVEAVAEVNRVDIIAMIIVKTLSHGSANALDESRNYSGNIRTSQSTVNRERRLVGIRYHSKSLYMMVKNTWRKRLTAFTRTARR